MASGTSSWLRGVIALLVLVAMTAAMAACGGSLKPTSNSTARQSTNTATQTGGGPVPSAAGSQTSGNPGDNPASGVRDLPCREFIATQPPAHNMRVLLGVVALPTSPPLRRALQTARSDLHDPAARLFAKSGLDIRAGARLRLIVPDWLRTRFSIGWGNAGEGHRGTTIVVDACTGPPGAKWLVYAGGYYVRDPFCVPPTVAAEQQRRRVRIGVGKGVPRAAPTAPADTGVNDPGHSRASSTPGDGSSTNISRPCLTA